MQRCLRTGAIRIQSAFSRKVLQQSTPCRLPLRRVSAMTNSQLTFYNAPICPYAHRAWIALAEKKIDFHEEEVDLQNKSEDFKAQYAKAHPDPDARAKVPLLIDGDDYVIESNLVVEYLDEKYSSGTKLFPADPVLRYKVRLFADLWSSSVNNYKLMSADTPEAKEAAVAELEKGLQAVDTLLRTQGNEDSGSFFLGGQFSFAEVSTMPFVRRMLITLPGMMDYDVMQKLNELKLDRLERWIKASMERESNKSTGPTDEYILDYIKKRYGKQSA